MCDWANSSVVDVEYEGGGRGGDINETDPLCLQCLYSMSVLFSICF